MDVCDNLAIAAVLWDLQVRFRNWHALSYDEKGELLRQFRAFFSKYRDVMEPRLTEQTLRAINKLEHGRN